MLNYSNWVWLRLEFNREVRVNLDRGLSVFEKLSLIWSHVWKFRLLCSLFLVGPPPNNNTSIPWREIYTTRILFRFFN